MRYADYVQWELEHESQNLICWASENSEHSETSQSSLESLVCNKPGRKKKKKGKPGKVNKSTEEGKESKDDDLFLDTAILKKRQDMANRVYFHQMRLERTLQHLYCECFNNLVTPSTPPLILNKAEKAVLLTRMFKRLNSDPQILEDVRESGMGQIEDIPWVEKSKSVIKMWQRFVDAWPQSLEQIRGEAVLMWQDDLRRAKHLIDLKFSAQRVFEYMICRGCKHVTRLAFGWSEKIHEQAILKWMENEKIHPFCGTCFADLSNEEDKIKTCKCHLHFCNDLCMFSHSLDCLENSDI